MQFFNVLRISFENFKQLFLVHLDVHFSWELHRIHHHLSNQNVYSDFHSIPNDFLCYFKNWHFPAHQLVEGASKPQRGARFGNIRESQNIFLILPTYSEAFFDATHSYQCRLTTKTCGTPLPKRGRWGGVRSILLQPTWALAEQRYESTWCRDTSSRACRDSQ